MICVSDTPDVEQVTLGPGGILEGLAAGSLVIDHSSISPRATRRLAEAVAAKGAHWLDAPVSGGSEGAARGTLSIMVGGDAGTAGAGPPLPGGLRHHHHPRRPHRRRADRPSWSTRSWWWSPSRGSERRCCWPRPAASTSAAPSTRSRAGPPGRGCWPTGARRWPGATGGPASPSTCSRRTFAWRSRPPTSWACPCPATALVFQLYRALQQRGLGAEGNHALVKALEEMSGITLGETGEA